MKRFYTVQDSNGDILATTLTKKECLISLIIDDFIHITYNTGRKEETVAEYLNINEDTTKAQLIEIIQQMNNKQIDTFCVEFGFKVCEQIMWSYKDWQAINNL